MSAHLAHRAARGQIDSEVLQWITTALRRHLADGADLETALSLDRASRLRQRNQALHEAAGHLAADDGAWHQAGRLARAIRRYQSRVAPLLARGQCSPLPPLDEALHRAFQSGVRVPGTQRNLFELLR